MCSILTGMQPKEPEEEQEPSSEPKWITVFDGSDRNWRLISMYELQELMYAINEECVGKNDGCPPGHLKEMHGSGNEIIDRARARPQVSAIGLLLKRRPNRSDPTYQELVDFARWTQNFWRHGIEIMRENKLVIKTDEPMEKLAFTFYSDLCEIDSVASHLFQEGYGDKNHRNESAVVSQTIAAYPKPYEERIRAEATAAVLKQIEDLETFVINLADNQNIVLLSKIQDEIGKIDQSLRSPP
jgi:hypothetical protein